MTFPTPNTKWPMPKWEPVREMIEHAALWWEGDTSQLTSKYHGQYRPSQYSNGLVGDLSRWFWGAPEAQQKRRVHMPLAADIAATSATLLFDRPPQFTHPELQDTLDDILDPNVFPSELLVAGESCAALGAVGWRVIWDSYVSEHPWIDWVDADAVFPTFKYGRVESVMFVEQLPAIPQDNHVYRLFTLHERGRISYRLMAGKENNIGSIKPLGSHPATVPLVHYVDADGGQDTGMDCMTAGYIPNARPVVGLRRDGQLRHIGRPDLTADLFPLFDSLDEVWTELRAEVRLSRKKVIVPDWMLDTRGFGNGASFDNDREIYSPIKGRPDQGMRPEIYAPSLRVNELLDAATAWTDKIIQRANYSPASFGLDTATGGGGAVTAREIDARYDASLRTWSAKSAYWAKGLKDAATALLQRDLLMHGYSPDVEPPKVLMERPVQETQLDKAQTVQALDAARAVSTEQKIAMLWPEWDGDQQSEEVRRVLAEHAGVVDPLTFTDDDQPLDG